MFIGYIAQRYTCIKYFLCVFCKKILLGSQINSCRKPNTIRFETPVSLKELFPEAQNNFDSEDQINSARKPKITVFGSQQFRSAKKSIRETKRIRFNSPKEFISEPQIDSLRKNEEFFFWKPKMIPSTSSDEFY